MLALLAGQSQLIDRLSAHLDMSLGITLEAFELGDNLTSLLECVLVVLFVFCKEQISSNIRQNFGNEWIFHKVK